MDLTFALQKDSSLEEILYNEWWVIKSPIGFLNFLSVSFRFRSFVMTIEPNAD